jgi:hypothetical protein
MSKNVFAKFLTSNFELKTGDKKAAIEFNAAYYELIAAQSKGCYFLR